MPQIVLTTLTAAPVAVFGPENYAQLVEQFDRKMMAAEMYGASVRSGPEVDDDNWIDGFDEDEIDHEL